MDEQIKHEIHSAFAVYVHRKTDGGFAYELKDADPKKLKEFIAVFISEAEAVLIDLYGLDEEEKQIVPDEYMKRKTELSSPYGSAITEDIEIDD